MANMLYNGVELLDINTVWTDKTTYPYAHIYETNGMYGLVISTHPALFRTRGSYTADYLPTGAVCMQYMHTQTAWYYLSSKTIPSAAYGYDELNYTKGFKIIWASYDVYRSTDNEFAENDGSLYLAASEPVPVGGSHVTTSSGDGFALYNGVKLPNIDNLEFNHSIKTSIILDVDVSAYAEGKFYYLHAPLSTGSSTKFYLGTTSAVVAAAAQLGLQLDGVGVWTESTTSVPNTFNYTNLWADEGMSSVGDASSNPYYGLYSAPIPLDGMTVIEWDGDTTGLTELSNFGFPDMYMVSNTHIEIPNSGSYVCAVWNGKQNLVYTDQTPLIQQSAEIGGGGYWALTAMSGAKPFVASANVPDYSLVGTAFMYIGKGLRTTLFAYRVATELKPVYKRIGSTWVKQTAYERQNGKWVLISAAT